MLKLHTSNRLETLAESLAETLRRPLGSPLRPEVVMVQSQGMARWLKLQLATQHGICANYSFPFPRVFCAEVLAANGEGRARHPVRAVDQAQAGQVEPGFDIHGVHGVTRPTISGEQVLGREAMTWEIMRLLPEMVEQPEYRPLKHYLAGEADLRKRFQLSSQIANLLDQYLVFRPDLMLAWDEGRSGLGGGRSNEHEAWQSALWRRLREGKEEPHLAALWRKFGERAGQASFNPQVVPERISIFGISALPPSYLEILCALGSAVEVHLFLLQPSKEYWGLVVSARESEKILKAARKGDTAGPALHLERGNSLLASTGNLGRDFLNLVLDAGQWDEETVFPGPAEDTLLHHIQADIFHLRDRGREGEAGHGLANLEAGPGAEQAGNMAPLSLALPPLEGEREPSRAGEGSVGKSPALLGAGCPKLSVSKADSSVRVHSCHGPLREVEVLYDHLLEWFEHNPALTPRDVLVMTPDIEAYAPFIQAVFDAPEDPGQRIPFSVADRSARASSHVIAAFFDLLSLPTTRLETTAVLRFLEPETVRVKFGLSETDLDIIRAWVRRTNIRWGKDAQQRESLGLPGMRENTWQQGMDRLLLGYAMVGGGERSLDAPCPPEQRQIEHGPLTPARSPSEGERENRRQHSDKSGLSGRMFNGVLPFDDVEGSSAEALGHLAEYLQRVFETVETLRGRRSVGEWEKVLLAMLDGFFQPAESQVQDVVLIRTALRELASQAEAGGCVEAVDLAVMLEALNQVLEEDRFGAGFLTGGVTFCALKPMRSIPFKVIALIGMNDNAFPRSDRHLSFDLMAQRPRLGDRSLRADDRYLFLETLLSARERLHISYVGQSIRDNSEAAPSVLVSELLDYVAQGYELSDGEIVKDHVLVRHRLQAFSPAYFTGEDARLFSYSAENCQASQFRRAERALRAAFVDTPLSEPEAEWRTVDVAALGEFFCNPAKWLVTRRMGLRLEEKEEALEGVEPFDVEGLDRYSIQQDLVELGLKGVGGKEALQLMKASGRLPLGEPGAVRFRGLQAEVQAFLEQLRPHLGAGYLAPVPVDHTLGEFRLTGAVRRLTAYGSLHYRCTSVKAKDLLRFWIQHLVVNTACPTEMPRASVLLGREEAFRAPPLGNAPDILARLLELYWQGLRRPLKFFPQTAWAYAEAAREWESGESRQDPAGVARRNWKGNPFQNARGESEDPYFDLCFRQADALDEEFQQTARAVFGPLLRALDEVKE